MAGRCAASEQPPSESDKNALSDHLLSRVRQPYVRPRPTRQLPVRRLPGATRAGGRAETLRVAHRAHRRPAAAGVPAVPPALLRQHRRPARPADDQCRGRHPGLRPDALLLLRRARRGLRTGATHRAGALRRRDRRRRRPPDARSGRERGTVAGLDGAGGAGLRRQRLGVAALRVHRGAVRLLRGEQPGAQCDGAEAPRQGAAAGSRSAEHGVVQPGLHVGPVIGALAISWQGFGAAYTIDIVTFFRPPTTR